jgi:hypothetical protein
VAAAMARTSRLMSEPDYRNAFRLDDPLVTHRCNDLSRGFKLWSGPLDQTGLTAVLGLDTDGLMGGVHDATRYRLLCRKRQIASR